MKIGSICSPYRFTLNYREWFARKRDNVGKKKLWGAVQLILVVRLSLLSRWPRVC